MNRRAFLKLTGKAATAVVGAGSGLLVFEEPLIASPYKRWITDKGDWFEVFVPAWKTLAKETFDKPILLILGRGATFADCRVNGFANVLVPESGSIRESFFNASGCISKHGRSGVVECHGKNMELSGCVYVNYPSGVEILRQLRLMVA